MAPVRFFLFVCLFLVGGRSEGGGCCVNDCMNHALNFDLKSKTLSCPFSTNCRVGYEASDLSESVQVLPLIPTKSIIHK